eukprot:Skav232840  [mRNA]  locus=scaffold1834:125606:149384:- [translate_table: standard]
MYLSLREFMPEHEARRCAEEERCAVRMTTERCLSHGYLLLSAEPRQGDAGGELFVEALKQVHTGLLIYVLLMIGVLGTNGFQFGLVLVPNLFIVSWSLLTLDSFLWPCLPLDQVMDLDDKDPPEEDTLQVYEQSECHEEIVPQIVVSRSALAALARAKRQKKPGARAETDRPGIHSVLWFLLLQSLGIAIYGAVNAVDTAGISRAAPAAAPAAVPALPSDAGRNLSGGPAAAASVPASIQEVVSRGGISWVAPEDKMGVAVRFLDPACFTKCTRTPMIYMKRLCAMGQLLDGFLEKGTSLASDLGLAKVPKWIFHMDGDTVMVNHHMDLASITRTWTQEAGVRTPHWLSHVAQVVFYERFHNAEIMAGNYAVQVLNFLGDERPVEQNRSYLMEAWTHAADVQGYDRFVARFKLAPWPRSTGPQGLHKCPQGPGLKNSTDFPIRTWKNRDMDQGEDQRHEFRRRLCKNLGAMEAVDPGR